MFKIYLLALLSFLTLQNSYAADQKEEFPGEAYVRRKLVQQQEEIEHLQQLYKKLFQEKKETPSRLSNTLSKSENEKGNEEPMGLEFFSKMKLEHDLKSKEFEHYLNRFKSKQDKEREDIIEEIRHEASKQKRETERHIRKQEVDFKYELEKQKHETESQLKHQEGDFNYQLYKQKSIFEKKIDKLRRKGAIKYKQLGITSLLKGRNEENLPYKERSPYISLNDFPLTFDHHDDNSCSVYLKLSEEDQESLRASGVNQDLIDNLFSHLQTDVSALYDMVQRGYQARQQNRQ